LNIDENKKILPDAHPPPYGKPITVVISDDVLLVQEYQVSALLLLPCSIDHALGPSIMGVCSALIHSRVLCSCHHGHVP
jgi:hypothetical protein